jgi:hypothetical protein
MGKLKSKKLLKPKTKTLKILEMRKQKTNKMRELKN